MSEQVMSINALPSYLINTLKAENVKVRELNRIITIVPIENDTPEKKYSCPFLGIGKESSLTVDKFIEWKNEERKAEYEKELHS